MSTINLNGECNLHNRNAIVCQSTTSSSLSLSSISTSLWKYFHLCHPSFLVVPVAFYPRPPLVRKLRTVPFSYCFCCCCWYYCFCFTLLCTFSERNFTRKVLVFHFKRVLIILKLSFNKVSLNVTGALCVIYSRKNCTRFIDY